MTITKAVFPVAGMGIRFLPVTKASPKEMLPIVDKPLIQYAVEEAIAAGIKELIFVTSGTKRAIEDHFDTNYELEAKLAQSGKQELLASVRHMLPDDVSCVYIRQPAALGLGHAVLCAKPLVDNAPFAVILADDLLESQQPSCLASMIEIFSQTGSSVIAVETIDPQDTMNYGIVQLNKTHQAQGSGPIEAIVEKPSPEAAPSNLAVIGRYILTPSIFAEIEAVKLGAGGEIQLTDAIANLLKSEQVIAQLCNTPRYDCGGKLGYLQATINYALHHPEVAQQFRAYLKKLTETLFEK